MKRQETLKKVLTEMASIERDLKDLDFSPYIVGAVTAAVDVLRVALKEYGELPLKKTSRTKDMMRMAKAARRRMRLTLNEVDLLTPGFYRGKKRGPEENIIAKTIKLAAERLCDCYHLSYDDFVFRDGDLADTKVFSSEEVAG